MRQLKNEESNRFVLDEYEQLLKVAKSNFSFQDYRAPLENGRNIIWRHDVDFSPNRACKMAELETEIGVKTSYFFQLTSKFYNLFEEEIRERVVHIRELGHEVGLHFDQSIYKVNSSAELELKLKFERDVFEELTESKISTFTLHNPTLNNAHKIDSLYVVGLFNASHEKFVKNFTYCSDSNGLWKYRNAMEVLRDPSSQNVYLLTHPEWWQEDELLPRQRVSRCVNGRAANCLRYYDELLLKNGRPNTNFSDD